MKQIVWYPYLGILLSNKTEQTTDTLNNLDGSQGHCVKWIEAVWKGYIKYTSIDI